MSNHSILLVDDDAFIHEELAEALEAEGYAVWHEVNAVGAIETLRQNMGIRIVLLDLRLPGEGGQQVLETLRRDFGCHHAVIIVTGHGSKEAAIEAVRGGATDFLEKPVTPEALFAAVQRAEREIAARDGADWAALRDW